MRDRKLFRSFVWSTMAFFVLLVPLTADAPMASGSGCEWDCATGYTLHVKALRCMPGGDNCMVCNLRCDY